MVARKTVCLRRLGGNRGGELQAGRFFANPKVTAAKIVEGWSLRTGAASAGRHVLAIQDTTEVKFPTKAQRRRGLGPVKQGNTYGVLVHAMIGVDAVSHACFGLVGGDVWTRDGVMTEHHRDRPLSERESRRWLETAEQAKKVLASAAMVTVVDDREGDIYPKWASVPRAGFHLLTRAMVDRRLIDGPRLALRAQSRGRRCARCSPPPQLFRWPQRGQSIFRPVRRIGAKRTAAVELRFGEVEICRPRDERDRTLAKTVRLRLVEVREANHPREWSRCTGGC